ncbi:MAG: hybrid sensor histidine kinase/response regulator [Steroidobacteraceae bacterium]
MTSSLGNEYLQAPVKCLLVDDLEENILALSALLRAPDVEILTASSGVEALELLLKHEVALAFLDVQMPDMDGFELAELMRGSERSRHVPIIFVTAGAQDRHRLFKGYDAGAVDFLYKPIEPHVLRHKASVFFQLHRQKQQLAHELRVRTETLRMNEMFTAVLGHDLRNPLASFSAGTHLLRRSPLAQESKTILDLLEASTQRMAGLINDVLDLARARLAGGIAVHRESADLGKLIGRVVREHEAAFPGRIEVRQEGDLTGEWDSGRLAQVASNLIGNALHHGAGGAVEVKLDGTNPDAVTLTVANAGAISPAVLPHLFDPFHGTRDASRKGLGLGLYIVQQLVHAHHGRVEVHTGDANRTSFTVSLPRR